MSFLARRRFYRASSIVVFVASAAFLAACATPQPKAMVSKTRSKEYFAESEYGVKASPRVTSKKSRLKRGGGRDQLGKPYKVRGKWYYPKEDRDYKKVGAASWYGDAFHGRLTANGEIYDMTHLTAAHPTMPLPSYARVTNTKNGSSVIVRVNDRGPYAHGRIIDLSKRAAEMLDYAHNGTANVQVEYVGRAPLDGHDEQYLMASYRPAGRSTDPLSDGLPEGVMIAMNGPTPSAPVGVTAAAFPGTLTDSAARPAEVAPALAAVETMAVGGELELPVLGPIAPERPLEGFGNGETQVAFAAMSYANERVARASEAFAALEGNGLAATDVVASWKRQNPATDADAVGLPYVAAGTFASEEEAGRLVRTLSGYGRTVLEKSKADGAAWYTVNLYADGRQGLDELLQTAWDNGAPDAMTVRD